jgi:hypothetical protein
MVDEEESPESSDVPIHPRSPKTPMMASSFFNKNYSFCLSSSKLLYHHQPSSFFNLMAMWRMALNHPRKS